MKLVFATGNKGKLREVESLLKAYSVEVISLKDFNDVPEIIEDADSFEGNSLIKVRTIYEFCKLPTIGDDSGLVVEQLNGMPGIYSARYAGENCTYEDNNRKLLQELKKFPKPHRAKFVCCLSYKDDSNEFSVTGELSGEIIEEYRGSNGFGYDPLFRPDGEDRTLAEMSAEEKNRISHRAKAFEKLKHELIERKIL